MSIRTWITDAVIDPAAVLDAVGSADDGAVLLFLGTVRNRNDGREVTGMRYDAYRTMAEKVLREIAEETAGEHGTDRIAAVHRTGELEIGEISVAVAVSSPHRAEAFAACRRLIDDLKLRLPVWKQEHYVEGSEWLEGNEPPVAEGSR